MALARRSGEERCRIECLHPRRFNPTSGKFLPEIRLPNGDIPTGIAVGADGNIWFAVANYTQPNSIGEIVLH
jgi:streptogramin lyase